MKKLKVGMIGGGGPSNFFGGVHRRCIALDGTRELVAGALRSNPQSALESAKEMGIDGFADYKAMLEACKDGRLSLDYVVIVTPNYAHFEPAALFLEAGIPVLCEKPVAMIVAEAQKLHDIASEKEVPFVLAHTYTGHPMLMVAKEMVKRGDIGEIRKVESWYNQGWLATALEREGLQQASWRTDPKRAGISCCGGDIGTHAFVAATWTTGMKMKKLSARLNTFVEGRALDDDFNVIAEMENGATAVITATQIAIGYKNDSGVRIYGSKGSIEWHQERAEKLLVRKGEADEIYWLGANYSYVPEAVKPYLRTPCGHFEDFLEALGNLHMTMELTIRRRNGENVPEPFDHPDSLEGVEGMKFVKAAVDSSNNNGAWTDL